MVWTANNYSYAYLWLTCEYSCILATLIAYFKKIHGEGKKNTSILPDPI